MANKTPFTGNERKQIMAAVEHVAANPTPSSIAGNGWDDIVAFFVDANGKGIAEPKFEDIGNGSFGMNFTAGDSLMVNFHIPHLWKVGSDAFLHVHWFNAGAMTAGDAVTWEMSYVIAKGHAQGESMTVARTVISHTYIADGTEIAGEHIVSESVTAVDLKEADSIMMVEVKMVSSTGAGKIYGITSDIHYETDGNRTTNRAPGAGYIKQV